MHNKIHADVSKKLHMQDLKVELKCEVRGCKRALDMCRVGFDECKKGYHDVVKGYQECAKGFDAVKEQCEEQLCEVTSNIEDQFASNHEKLSTLFNEFHDIRGHEDLVPGASKVQVTLQTVASGSTFQTDIEALLEYIISL